MSLEKLVDVNAELIRRAAETVRRERRGEDEVPAREVFARAVESWLPVVVALAEAAGLTHRATGQRRPRRFDERTWAALERAEPQVDVAKVALLRACLELQAQHGDGTAQFVRALSRRVAATEADLRLALLHPEGDAEE